MRKPVLRKDAQERLDRLIAAAVDLYASDGSDVPLERVADRAGVSRPTLYRNFPDREALSAAVIEVHLEELTRQIAAWADRDDAFFLGLQLLASKTVASGGLTKIIPIQRQTPSQSSRFRLGVESALAGPMARAQCAGLLRQDFTLEDMHRATLMLAGGGLDNYGADIDGAIGQSLALLMQGLAPPAHGGANGDQTAKL